MNHNYSIVIQWSEKDDCFIASLPEWSGCNARGASYEEVLANAQRALTNLVELSTARGISLPEPKDFQIPSVAG